MNVISLVFFLATIALAFFRKNNIGILALAVGTIAVRVFGLKDKVLVSSINVGLFATLVGITLLFAIITRTGAMDLIAKKIVALAGKRIWLIPILISFAGFAVSAAGPGGVPALAIIPPLAAAIALQVGYKPLMLVLIGINGMTAGRFSPITPESAIISGAVAKTGLVNVIPGIFVSILITMIILDFILYFYFKGYMVKAPETTGSEEEIPPFNGKQKIALASILLMLVLIVFVKVNIGLAAFSVAALLLVFHVDEDAAVIKAIPWGTIVMVLGVGALLSIVDKMGGIKMMNDALASVMSQSTAVPIMGVSAGLLSLVSSALGVVYPTMMPMCAGIAEQVGNINPVALMSAVAGGGALAGTSPMSTGGALVIAAIAGAKKGNFSKEEANKIFVELIIVSALALVLLVVASAIFYSPVCNMLSPQVMK